MTNGDIQARTKQFALRIVHLYSILKTKGAEADVLGRQLLRAGTSVGANVRAAARGKSDADFVNKLKICEEEADECVYWLELLAEGGIMPANKLELLLDEAKQITAILVASIKHKKENIRRQKSTSSASRH